MRIEDARVVRLLDLLSADLQCGNSRSLEAPDDYPALTVERTGARTYLTSQPIHSAEDDLDVTRMATWHQAPDRAWLLVALAPVYRSDVEKTAAGAIAVLPTLCADHNIQAAYATAWLGIIIPYQQGGWPRILAAVNRSRSA